MIIKPRVRGFVCVTAHPTGCEANVREQVEFVKRSGPIDGPRSALVIGASTGYGLAARITAAFGCRASTVGVFFEKPPSSRRPATAGWYNTAALEKLARAAGLAARSVNGDAFSDEIKDRTIEILKTGPGVVDLVVYSLASPRRTHPKSGQVFQSVLKPIGQPYHGRTLNTDKAVVKPIVIDPAAEEEIAETVAVMGGEDWELWMDALDQAKLLADGCRTVAFTYLGPKLTWPIYRDGTIGKAKEDLDRAAAAIGRRLGARGGKAQVAVMKAVVTQASSAIPVVPLYISLLFDIMKKRGGHEGCIEQMCRLFATQLYGDAPSKVDETGRIRLDDREMRAEIQAEIDERWPKITTENLRKLTDFTGYQAEFLRLFGFGLEGVDYEAEVDPNVPLEA